MLRRTTISTAQEISYKRLPTEMVNRFAFIVSKHFFLETDAFYNDIDTLTVICSFSAETLTESAIAPLCQGELLLSNYDAPHNAEVLHPYEARIYLR